eukprot:TRINITY_DN5711_c0_g1_i2.p1 TRINITY_DN5711_c0_g1~~TRINITY_DN5711_c0_g1_i2.p1  ORF type:complete len:854 (-),score=141.05 TRINITY_DN5711_c0_g1_i2:45-2606(-)
MPNSYGGGMRAASSMASAQSLERRSQMEAAIGATRRLSEAKQGGTERPESPPELWTLTGASKKSLKNLFGTPAPVTWQWEHRTGWRDYQADESARIESAYNRGEPYIRLKSGKSGVIPMELFFSDMVQRDPISGNVRNIRRGCTPTCWRKVRRKVMEVVRSFQTGRARTLVFAHYANDRRKELEEQAIGLDEDLLALNSAADISRSTVFFVLAMLVVALNCIWIGIAAELYNKPLSECPPHVEVIENLFCIVFLFEFVIRFCALRECRLMLRDRWLMFDGLLVIVAMVETWVFPLMLIASGGDLEGKLSKYGMLRLARLLRLTRLGRLVRVLRVFPEIMTLLKGVLHALRSVFFTLLLLFMLLFCFSIVFKTQVEDSDTEYVKATFNSVPDIMWLLLMRGTFLDDPTVVLTPLRHDSPLRCAIFVLFIFMTSFTVMNMLIGIVVDVVAQVSSMEKEEAAVTDLKAALMELLECHDSDDDGQISKDEWDLMMKNPELRITLDKFGVDIINLMSLRDVLFPGDEELDDCDVRHGGISGALGPIFRTQSMAQLSNAFCITAGEFLAVVLRLRAGHSASVTDVVTLRDFTKQRFDRIEEKIQECLRVSPKHSVILSDYRPASRDSNDYRPASRDSNLFNGNPRGKGLGPAYSEYCVMSQESSISPFDDAGRPGIMHEASHGAMPGSEPNTPTAPVDSLGLPVPPAPVGQPPTPGTLRSTAAACSSCSNCQRQNAELIDVLRLMRKDVQDLRVETHSLRQGQRNLERMVMSLSQQHDRESVVYNDRENSGLDGGRMSLPGACDAETPLPDHRIPAFATPMQADQHATVPAGQPDLMMPLPPGSMAGSMGSQASLMSCT